MTISFTLQGKGFSVNQTYYRNRATKTTEAKAWEKEVLAQLDEHKCLTEFADAWKAEPTNTGIEVRFCFNYPPHIFYTKDKMLSSKTFDVDNCAKILLDTLFGARLGINDKNVTKLVLEKAAGPQHTIDVHLKIR